MTDDVVLLTVAISTRDRPQALARCLESVLAGETRPAEIVIVDQSRDRSTEDVAEAARGKGVDVVYVRHAGSGLGASQNTGVARARRAIVSSQCWPSKAVTRIDVTVPGSRQRALTLMPSGCERGV